MNESIKFNPEKLAKLNNPERLKILDLNLIWNMLELQSPKILLDIGAGTGFFAKEFLKKMSNGKIYACDNSKPMIQWMEENIKNEDIIPLETSESTILLPDDLADLAYMINVHHELLEPEKILIEIHRLLKTGAKILIIDWKAELTKEGPPLNIRVSDKRIIKQLNDAGFKNVVSHNILPLKSLVIGEK